MSEQSGGSSNKAKHFLDNNIVDSDEEYFATVRRKKTKKGRRSFTTKRGRKVNYHKTFIT